MQTCVDDTPGLVTSGLGTLCSADIVCMHGCERLMLNGNMHPLTFPNMHYEQHVYDMFPVRWYSYTLFQCWCSYSYCLRATT